MSWISPIPIDAKDPEYYAELLKNAERFKNISRLANRRLPRDQRPCSDIPRIQAVDDSARRLQTLLDVLAVISLCQRRNVSAVMASLKEDSGTLETRLYIVFNHENDEAAHCCPQHLETIFNMLREVPYIPPAIDGSPKVIEASLEINLIEICKAIHNYSFDIFAHRVTKHKEKLLGIRGYIERDQTHFTPEQRSTLAEFFGHVLAIITVIANAEATKQLPTITIQMLLNVYWYWTDHNLLPEDLSADNKLTLLDRVDMWLSDGASDT